MGQKDRLDEMPEEIQTKLKSLLKNGTSQELKSSSEYLELRKKWANEAQGYLTGYDCKECKNRGYITDIENGYLISVECKCMNSRRSLWRIEKSGMKDLLKTHTFSAFETKEPWQADMKQRALDFVNEKSECWFATCGTVGAGKTHICTAICRRLISDGREVRYMLWRDESVKLKAMVNDADEYTALITPYKKVDVLYIDDLFKTKKGAEISQGDINLAFEILNYRAIRKDLITIISSEKTLEEITEIDEATGSRIFQRCGEYYVRLVDKPNWRLK